MRITLVTETFFPQVNGVSRTLGELARHLRACGDLVQLVCPDYGTEARQEGVLPVPSVVLPFYKELHLPRPPFGRVHRAVAAFRPEIIHIATEATLGWSLLRHALRSRIPVVSSFHTNFDQYSTHYGLGWSRSLIWRVSALVSQHHARDVRSLEHDNPRSRKTRLRATAPVAPRR